jgi:hypothetical protein
VRGESVSCLARALAQAAARAPLRVLGPHVIRDEHHLRSAWGQHVQVIETQGSKCWVSNQGG